MAPNRDLSLLHGIHQNDSSAFSLGGSGIIVAAHIPSIGEETMAITLYDLAGVEVDRRFSPFCWRTRMALAHTGLEVETVPWRFTEKDRLPQPNGGRVPVIIDCGPAVHDSSTIAEYLENRYPDRASLFLGEVGHALTRFIQNWTETVLQPGLIGALLLA